MPAVPDTRHDHQRATFGAGCFWGVESAFCHVPGVSATAAGYMGGTLDHPTYRDVCTDTTGHAEVVEVVFDPAVISYERLLDLFFCIHDPTTPGRQGVDIGTQYRSVIFCHTLEQKAAAESCKERLDRSGRFRHPIATEIVPAQRFWRAEEYHQRYHEKHGGSGCGI